MGKTAFGSLGVPYKLTIEVPEGLASGGDILIYPEADSLANIGVVFKGKGTGIAAGALAVDVTDASAAGGQVDFWGYVAPRKLRVIDIREVHGVIGGAGATVMPRKVTSGQAPSAGLALLTAAFDLVGVAANTPSTGTLTATDADRILAVGNGIALDYSGTLTGLRSVTISITLIPEA